MLVESKAEATALEIEAARQAFLAIPDKIEGMTNIEWGTNNSPEGKNRDYNIAISMLFKDKETRERYLVHPEHAALKVPFRKIIKQIIVFDYAII